MTRSFSTRRKNNCKPIPESLHLCHDIEYTEMRLPNLLGHESMSEVLQQASSWIPLVKKQCHPDTRKFLCSCSRPCASTTWTSPSSRAGRCARASRAAARR
ncbi:hypothetical protein CRUP_022302 [Coryphaenoides rupestris]|nr:hypothetical protein CRUP_022302 [Coryphaenoides rupestris]